MKKYVTGCCTATLITLSLLTGCSTAGTAVLFENETSATSDYYSDYALSSAEYKIFLNKEIANAKNEILTFILLCKKFEQSDDCNIAVIDIETCEKNINESYKNIKMTKPPADRENDRLKIMEILAGTLDTLDTAKKIVNGDDRKELNAVQQKLETYNISLSLYSVN